MDNWKNISIDGIPQIERCVAEFNVTELKYTPWRKFKVKIYENKKGEFTGYTNIMLKGADETPYCGVGYGNSIEAALEDTIIYFMNMIKQKNNLTLNDFCNAEPFDF